MDNHQNIARFSPKKSTGYGTEPTRSLVANKIKQYHINMRPNDVKKLTEFWSIHPHSIAMRKLDIIFATVVKQVRPLYPPPDNDP